ncbi:MAG: FAD-dependent oxidoreductase [Crocinitomicaceae bacterium]|nr:FAD-dependent oxidoreductase [Crocinitomicaceae bacterium]|tara:strand:- start:13052 stop:14347 length:1296 start_codon:yes stop_codon:yes gene_type:complete
MNNVANLPEKRGKRVVIIGAGFAGLKLARSLSEKHFQVVLLDKNNYHQFQPLFYQVATSGLEPSSISFPIRKILQHKKHVHFRVAELQKVRWEEKTIETSIGEMGYDYLVLALGANTNFFGNQNIERHAISMKSVSEALLLRNRILENYERALNTSHGMEQESLMNVVITGGGPTGVELAGAIAEMRQYVLPKDYPQLDFSKMTITLLEGSGRLLNGMSDHSGNNALKYLGGLNVKVRLNCLVEDYDGKEVKLKGGERILSNTLIWAAGVRANGIAGFPDNSMGFGGRYKVDSFSRVEFNNDVFVIGDQSIMITEDRPNGDPQVAQVAIQQAIRLNKNLTRLQQGKELDTFEYDDKGSMATVGRNLAVCDLPYMKMKGFLAWLLWLFVHLMSILGAKNKVFVFINWAWSYVTYDQSLRLLIKPVEKKKYDN